MSVFTPLNVGQVETWLADYSLGSLHGLHGISEGVQNSNFFIDTASGRYVLTLFEELSAQQLPFFIALMAHLAQHGIPCPAPVARRDGEYLGELQARPAVIVSCLSGRSTMQPTLLQCAAIGDMLARLHLAAQSFPGRQAHQRDAAWCRTTAASILPCLNKTDAALLCDELQYQAACRPPDLPRGVIHADLFRDNVLFVDETIGGLLDFYFAGVDDLLFDLAVTLNDWCFETPGGLNAAHSQALLAAYHARRPLSAKERMAWPVLLRAAALRFWLSRLQDFHLPRAGQLVARRNPDEYRSILRTHRDASQNGLQFLPAGNTHRA